MPGIPIRHTTVLDGEWTILSIRGVHPEGKRISDPHVELAMARSAGGRILQGRNGRPEIELRSVPVAELIDLYTGAVLVDNVVEASAGRLTEVCFSVEVDAARNPLWSRGDRDPRTHSLLVPTTLDDADLPAIVSARMLEVPVVGHKARVFVLCAEVFRFYYMSSSRITRTILSEDIRVPGRTLWQSDSIRLSQTGHGQIVFRRGVQHADVPVLARLALSTDGHALTEAQKIQNRLQTARLRGLPRPYPIIARPPFHGLATWRALAAAWESSDPPTFLIVKLLSCNAPFPWQSLSWRIKYDAVPLHVDGGAPGTSTSRVGGSSVKVDDEQLSFVYLDAGTVPAGAFLPRTVSVDDIADRFLALDWTKVVRDRPPGKGRPRGEKRAQQLKSASASALSASSQAASGEPQTQQSNLAADPVSESGEYLEREVNRIRPAEALRAVLDMLDCLQAMRGVHVDIRLVTESAAMLDGYHYNLCPQDADGKKPRWRYLDDRRTQLRPILIVEIRQNQQYGYLLELVRRPGESYCMLLLHAPDLSRLEDLLLREVIDSCAIAERATAPSGTAQDGTRLSVQRERHAYSKPPADWAADVLTKLGFL